MINFIEMKSHKKYIYIDFAICVCSVTIGPVGGTGVQGPVHGFFKSFPVGGGVCKIPTIAG